MLLIRGSGLRSSTAEREKRKRAGRAGQLIFERSEHRCSNGVFQTRALWFWGLRLGLSLSWNLVLFCPTARLVKETVQRTVRRTVIVAKIVLPWPDSVPPKDDCGTTGYESRTTLHFVVAKSYHPLRLPRPFGTRSRCSPQLHSWPLRRLA